MENQKSTSNNGIKPGDNEAKKVQNLKSDSNTNRVVNSHLHQGPLAFLAHAFDVAFFEKGTASQFAGRHRRHLNHDAHLVPPPFGFVVPATLLRHKYRAGTMKITRII